MNTGKEERETMTVRPVHTVKPEKDSGSSSAKERRGDRFYETVMEEFLTAIEKAVECYANVHRGAGPDSKISTRLHEEARKRILRWNKFSLLFFGKSGGVLSDPLQRCFFAGHQAAFPFR